jgi:hypothetical protein
MGTAADACKRIDATFGASASAVHVVRDLPSRDSLLQTCRRQRRRH